MSTTVANLPAAQPRMLDGDRLLPASRRGEPAWELALWYPEQGQWTEADYLALNTNRLVELSDGCLEFLPMALLYHQRIVFFFAGVLNAFVVGGRLGEVLTAPLPIRLWAGKMREPDVLFLKPGRATGAHQAPNGADLVMEVLSEGADNRNHDLITKRDEYARAGITEYWIIDPEQKQIIVLTLDGQAYREHGVFGPGTQAISLLLPGFAVDVDAVLAAGLGT